MTKLGEHVWSGVSEGWAEIYQPLIKVLYNIGFLGYSLGRKNPETYSHEEPDFLEKLSNIEATEAFFVHPAFRPALEIDHIA